MRPMKESGITYLGNIPINWQIVPIKAKYTFYTGFTPPSGEEKFYDSDGETWITIADIKSGITTTSDTHITRSYAVSKGRIIKKGSLLYSFKLSVGKTSVLGCDAYTNEAIASFPFGTNPCIGYLKYSSVFIVENANENIYGAKILNQQLINNARVPFPPLYEQHRIADFLDKKCAEIDTLTADVQKEIETLQEYRRSLISEAVTKGLDPDVEMKDSGVSYIGMIPRGWEVKRLRFLGRCQNGISKGHEFFGDEGDPFVSYSDVYKNETIPNPTGVITSTKDEQYQYSVKEGDIFFTRTSETIDEIGFSSVCLKTIPRATFAGFLIRVRPITKLISPRFSRYYFRSDVHRKYFVKEMNLVTRASLGQNLLKNLPVLLPPLSEQERITSYLDKKCTEIDSIIEVKQKQLETLAEYRKSLIYEYVTGKKEVV